MIAEIWKDVSGYEGLYEVSNYGRIRRDGKMIKQNKNVKSGYLSVMLCKNGKTKRVYTHRLVGSAFIDNPSGFPVINHKDENKQNNYAENLEWCDRSYNNHYGENAPVKSREKAVIQKSKDGAILRVWDSAEKAYKGTGVTRQSIGKCCLGKRKSAGGFLWKFA